MNPYSKLSPTDPSSVVCDSRAPQWKAREVIGAGTGMEIRPGRSDRLLVSFDSSQCSPAIEPGKSLVLAFSSSIGWKGLAFSVSAECAHRFVLKSMRCGLIEYVVDHPLACTLFSDAQCCECRAPKAVRHLPKDWPEVYPGLTFEFEIENIGDTPSHFRAAFEAIRLGHPCL